MSKSGFQKAVDAAQIARGLKNIAKGFASGGVKGAAVQAVKSFAPLFIKIAIILLVVFILIPVIVISALPAVLFGWGTVPDAELVERKEYADSMVSVYDRIEDYRSEIITDIKSKYIDDYDEVEVVDDGESLDIYWLISIDGVRADQDVYNLNEAEIKKLIKDSMEYSITIEEVAAEEEGGSSTTKATITISTIDSDALMNKLNYNEEQKNWATLLFTTTTAPQYLSDSDDDYLSASGLDYSGITFGEGSTQVVYFNQLDSRWANTLYGRSGTIGNEGCGPTALAMVVSTLTGVTRDPVEVSNWSAANGHRCIGSGSYHSLIPKGAEYYGLKVQGAGKNDGQVLVDALSDGKLIIAIMQKGHFTKTGHFIVLRGVTASGKILVADPVSRSRSEKEWDLSIILKEARGDAAAGGPFWIISK